MITVLLQTLQLSINVNCCEMKEINSSDGNSGGTQLQRNEEYPRFSVESKNRSNL